MVPESLAAVYAFLAFVAPGLVFQLLRERARPALDESAFREASRVALTSLVFTTVSILVLTLFSVIVPGVLVDLAEWMQSQSAYVGDHLWLVAWSVFAEVGVACILAWLAAAALSKWVDDPSVKISKKNVWELAILESRPHGKVAWVAVELKDDVTVWGYVHYFTTDLPLEDRELSLMGPGLSIRRKGEERKNLDVQYLLVPGPEVRRMKVSFEPKAEAAQTE